MYCYTCRAEIEDGAKFCVICGMKQPVGIQEKEEFEETNISRMEALPVVEKSVKEIETTNNIGKKKNGK